MVENNTFIYYFISYIKGEMKKKKKYLRSIVY